MKDILNHQDYPVFFAAIKNRIQQAQYQALKTVNKQLIELYWDIGKMIVEKQNALGWGKSVVEKLSIDLKAAFREVNTFSACSLWRMRNFCLIYAENTSSFILL